MDEPRNIMLTEISQARKEHILYDLPHKICRIGRFTQTERLEVI